MIIQLFFPSILFAKCIIKKIQDFNSFSLPQKKDYLNIYKWKNFLFGANKMVFYFLFLCDGDCERIFSFLYLQTKYSYLDVAGRTVVVLEKENVVPEHNSPFQVTRL